MRRLLAILLLLVGATAVPAQEGGSAAPERPVCSLNASQAPAIAALRLGMTAEQVLALFPGSSEDPAVRSSMSGAADQLGLAKLLIRPEKYQSKEKFAGINQITLSLLDGRVSNFSVGYNGPAWPHVDNFVAKVVEGTDLPAVDAWEAHAGLETQLKFLTCSDFEIRVFAGGEGGNLNYVLLSDLVAARTLKDRRAKAKEKSKQP